jgi:hypothetical protein
MRKKLIIGGAIVVALGLLRLGLHLHYLATRPAPSDVDQISALIEDARVGAEQGKPNMITDAIAENAVVEGMSRKQAINWLRSTLRQTEDLRVGVSAPAISVHGDDATADIASIQLDGLYQGSTLSLGVHDLQIRLHRNEVRKWLVFKQQRWQVVSASTAEGPASDW